MYWFVSMLRALVEMLMFCALGQGGLFLIAGGKHRENPIYRLLALIMQPYWLGLARLLRVRMLTTGFRILAVILLFITWIGLALIKRNI